MRFLNPMQTISPSTSVSGIPGPHLSAARAAFLRTRDYLSSQIIGQEILVEGLLIALLADGHLLVEGPPGLAKTRAIKALARALECDFHRTQFTPDMLPADLTGSEIYRPEQGTFQFQRGPLFHNLILADEINRAPAKVQSALLEAMAERQISVGQATYPLPPLFLVMATQNPIEQEGTYPLPEAQIDRFMMHLAVDYPDRATTLKIMRLARDEAMSQVELAPPAERLTQAQVFAARREALELHLADPVAEYIAALVDATRRPDSYSQDLKQWLRWGREPARRHRDGTRRPGSGVARRPRLRESRRRTDRCGRRPAASTAARLRRAGTRRHRPGMCR